MVNTVCQNHRIFPLSFKRTVVVKAFGIQANATRFTLLEADTYERLKSKSQRDVRVTSVCDKNITLGDERLG